jgi:large subunit ribosomal protein L16
VGLKAESATWLKANQLEAARRVISRTLHRGGKLWIRVFPHKPRTATSAETGMGGGRGSLSHFVAPVEAGRILFEIDGVPAELAEQALRAASYKLPLKTRIVHRT